MGRMSPGRGRGARGGGLFQTRSSEGEGRVSESFPICGQEMSNADVMGYICAIILPDTWDHRDKGSNDRDETSY